MVAAQERECSTRWNGGSTVRERTDLAGCSDVDLGWTPATNILPIRRTGLVVGGSTTIGRRGSPSPISLSVPLAIATRGPVT